MLRLLERGGGYSSECSESVHGIQGQRLSFRYVFFSLFRPGVGQKSGFNHAPSFLASLFFSPPLFLVEVRFPAAAEFEAVGLRAAAPRAFLVEEGTATALSCFSSPEEMTPFVGESGEFEVLIRFESCFGLPQHQPFYL